MSFSPRLRSGAALAVAAMALPVLGGTAAGAVTTGSAGVASAPSTASLGRAATPTADPQPGESVPSEDEVDDAKRAAAAAAKEVADITAQLERAQARLDELQRGVARAVSAHEAAQAQLATAQAAVEEAAADVAVARRAREHADRALSGRAALMYMQGGELQNVTTLLFAPPNVMSDLVVVLDQNAEEVRDNLDDASATAASAASQERFLTFARDTHATALKDTRARRAAAEKLAKDAGAEAATLGKQQEELTARLAELDKDADDLAERREAAERLALANRREAAARLDLTTMIGVQASGSGPRASQEIARSMMPAHGWDEAQFSCLVTLWHAESGWSWSATNQSSGAYGIPQALPGWKMASAGSDWLTNPATQITWGLGYIEDVYGSPCNAYSRFLSRSPHWY